MMKTSQPNYAFFAATALALIALALIVGLQVGKTTTTHIALPQKSNPATIEESRTASLLLPAITEEGHGAVIRLNVEMRPGNGITSISVDASQPYVGPATVDSMKNAVEAISRYSEEAGEKFVQNDFLFSFSLAPEAVEGKSAGAAMAVASLALVEGKELKRSFAITGEIQANGSITPVGAVLQKAQALKRAGITSFLVPWGEAVRLVPTVNQTETCTEQQLGNGVVTSCRTVQTVSNREVNISQEVGIDIVEVRNLREAFALMTG